MIRHNNKNVLKYYVFDMHDDADSSLIIYLYSSGYLPKTVYLRW